MARRAAAFALVLILLGAAAAVFWAARAGVLPNDGSRRLAGLSAPVEVIRDGSGVPHIFASSQADALRALGFVHAQDRRFQMELLRRAGTGELAEILGDAGLELDRRQRALGVARVCEEEVALLDDEERALTVAYAEGVNEATRAGAGRSLEFRALGLSPPPWTPAASLAVVKLLATGLGGDEIASKALATALRREVGDAAPRFLPPYPDDWAPPLVDGDPRSAEPRTSPGAVVAAHPPRSGRTRSAAPRTARNAALPLAALLDPWKAGGFGSNNWVVHGSRSATSSALLAYDPHLPILQPSIWHVAHLDAPGLRVIGAALPGLPAIAFGHNERVAWGFTNVGPDVHDLYVEEIQEGDPPRVRTPAGWEPLRLRREEIRVRGRAEPEVLVVRESRHGTLLSDMDPELTRLVLGGPDPARAVALASTFLRPSRPASFLTLDRARDWASFREGLRDYSFAAQNVVYADVDGNIGYQLAGQIPVREGRAPTQAVPGWEPGHEWVGLVPFEALPRLWNPPEGVIATANARITGPAYPYHLSTYWSDIPLRVARIDELLAAKPRLSLEDLAAIQLDVHQQGMARVVAWVLDAGSDDADLRWTRDELRGWDLRAEPGSRAAAIAQVLLDELADEVFRTRLPPHLFEAQRLKPGLRHVALVHAMDDPGAVLFDGDPAARDAALATAAGRARRRLEEVLGPDPAGWTWGALHPMVFEHPLAQVGGLAGRVLGAILNAGTFAAPGSWFTVNAAAWDPEEPWRVTGGVSFRLLVDTGDWSKARFVYAAGQSEHRASPNYADLAPDWVEGRYRPLLWSRAAIEADAASTLRLVP